VVSDSTAFNPRLPPSFDLSAAKRVKKILNQRNNPLQKKKVSVRQEGSEHPDGLLPIHLRSRPLPQLSPADVLFAQNNGASNIVKRRRKDLANHAEIFRNQPTRRQSVFVDDSAIESDGEGGDIVSTTTTPASSRHPSPARLVTTTQPSTNTLPVQLPIVKRSKIKRPKEHCTTCNRFFDGIKQLDFHKKSKKHLKQVRNSVSTHCKQCNRFFPSKHNFSTHKCENFLKN